MYLFIADGPTDFKTMGKIYSRIVLNHSLPTFLHFSVTHGRILRILTSYTQWHISYLGKNQLKYYRLQIDYSKPLKLFELDPLAAFTCDYQALVFHLMYLYIRLKCWVQRL